MAEEVLSLLLHLTQAFLDLARQVFAQVVAIFKATTRCHRADPVFLPPYPGAFLITPSGFLAPWAGTLPFVQEIPMSVSLPTCAVPAPTTPSTALTANEEQLIHQALRMLEQRLFHRGSRLEDPQSVRHYLRLALTAEKNEVFAVLFLDNQHRVLAFEPLFQGTVDSATVYPRCVVQRALAHNSAAVIFVHNHPSGSTQPSHNDIVLTQELKRCWTSSKSGFLTISSSGRASRIHLQSPVSFNSPTTCRRNANHWRFRR